MDFYIEARHVEGARYKGSCYLYLLGPGLTTANSYINNPDTASLCY